MPSSLPPKVPTRSLAPVVIALLVGVAVIVVVVIRMAGSNEPTPRPEAVATAPTAPAPAATARPAAAPPSSAEPPPPPPPATADVGSAAGPASGTTPAAAPGAAPTATGGSPTAAASAAAGAEPTPAAASSGAPSPTAAEAASAPSAAAAPSPSAASPAPAPRANPGAGKAVASGSVRKRDTSCDAPCPGSATDELVRALGSKGAAARTCYERALSNNSALSGRLEVALRVSPSGTACSATLSSDTLGDAAVAACVLARFKAGTFPKPTGGCVDASVPINFKPAGG